MGLSEEVKNNHYDKLQSVIDEQRTSQGMLVVIGDLNARIIHRNEDEKDIIGPFYNKKGPTALNNLDQKARHNRELFTELCLRNNLVAANTLKTQPLHRLLTFRKMTTKLDEYIQADNYEMLDYILIQHKWKNAVKWTKADWEIDIRSHHAPLIAEIKAKWKIPTSKPEKAPMYKGNYSIDAMKHINKNIHEFLKEKGNTYENWIKNIEDSMTDEVMKNKKKPRQEYLSEYTWELINMRNEAYKNGTEEINKRLNKEIKKSAKKDKKEFYEKHTTEGSDKDKWKFIKEMKGNFKRKVYPRKNRFGQKITLNERAEATA